jgi:hypothetical protein
MSPRLTGLIDKAMYERQDPTTALVMSPCPPILAIVFIAEIECRFQQVMVPHEMLVECRVGCRTGEVDLESVREVV